MARPDKVAAVTETLVVTADAAVIDTASSQSTTNLDQDYLQNLPTARSERVNVRVRELDGTDEVTITEHEEAFA